MSKIQLGPEVQFKCDMCRFLKSELTTIDDHTEDCVNKCDLLNNKKISSFKIHQGDYNKRWVDTPEWCPMLEFASYNFGKENILSFDLSVVEKSIIKQLENI